MINYFLWYLSIFFVLENCCLRKATYIDCQCILVTVKCRYESHFRTDPVRTLGTIVKTCSGNQCWKVHGNMLKSADQKTGRCQGRTECIAEASIVLTQRPEPLPKRGKKKTESCRIWYESNPMEFFYLSLISFSFCKKYK